MLSKLWNFINQPIISNSLAVVLVAIFGFLFTNYFQCKNQVVADNASINDLLDEIIDRNTALSEAIAAQDLEQDQRFLKIHAVLDPHMTYTLLAFKDRFEQELRHQIDQILQKSSSGPDKTEVSQIENFGRGDSECDATQLYERFDINDYCVIYFYSMTIRPTNDQANFRTWFSESQDILADERTKDKTYQDKRKAAFLTLMDERAKSLPTYKSGPALTSPTYHFLAAFATAAAEGRVFPKRTCLYRAIWP